MPAFSYIAGHAARRHSAGAAQLQALPRRRRSPLLLINHWIPPFPPSPALNGRSDGAFLRRGSAAARVTLGLKAAIVAVDFYQRTAVVEVTRRLDEGQ